MGKYEDILTAVGRAAPPPKYIRAYHASPYDFERFDFAGNMGRGEGQQAFGPGGYFSQNKVVTDEYRKQFLRFRPNTDGNWSARTVRDAEDSLRKAGSPEAAIASLEALLPSLVDDISLRPQVEDAINYLRGSRPPRVRTYEVSIGHSPESLLDYDRPLARQNKNVRSVISEDDLFDAAAEGGVIGPDFSVDGAIGPILSGHSAAGGRQAAFGIFENLRRSGVPGIQYLDGFSRSGSQLRQPTRNYVMFPGTEDSIRILRKN
jgi:hypothetical protein